MLQVLDNGVKITLQNKSLAMPLLTSIVIMGIALAVIGLLKILNIIGGLVTISLVVITILGIGFWQLSKSHKQVSSLAGGELLLTNQGFIHQHFDKTIQYQLQPNDSIQLTDSHLLIYNPQGKMLYHIQGFSEPQHATIAQAVLQGKTIKTQGKAIKMQG